MAFDYTKFQRWSSGFDLSNNACWNYTDTATPVATIVAANFFLPAYANLSVGDLIWIVASDVLTGEYAQVTAVSSTSVTVAVFNAVLGVGSVGTSNLAANAVTTAKITDANVTDAKMAANTLTSASIATDVIQYVKVPVTAAQLNAAYATPYVLIAAPGANKLIRIHDVTLEVDYGSAQFASGGALALQYDSTANGAGVLASAALPAATLNGFAADSVVGLAGAAAAGAASAMVNKGIYLSNLTGAFTTGTGTTVDFHISYSIVTTTL